MKSARRGSLANMAVPKNVQSSAPEPAAAEPAPTPKEPSPRRAVADMKTVQVRINKQGWKELRDLAADNETSLEALMVEALNDVLLKNQRPPIVQRRMGERGNERPE